MGRRASCPLALLFVFLWRRSFLRKTVLGLNGRVAGGQDEIHGAPVEMRSATAEP